MESNKQTTDDKVKKASESEIKNSGKTIATSNAPQITTKEDDKQKTPQYKPLPHNLGVYKIQIKQINIKSERIQQGELYLNLKLGQQIYKQKMIKNLKQQNSYTLENTLFLFQRKSEQTINIFTTTAKKQQQNNQNTQILSPFQQKEKKQLDQSICMINDQAFAQILMTPFVLMKNIQHNVTVYMVLRTQQMKIKQFQAGIIKLTIFYTPKFLKMLEIKPVKMDLIHSSSWFGKMDPFLRLTVSNNSHNTRPIQNGDIKTQWSKDEKQIRFPISSPTQKLLVQVIDHDIIKNDLVAKTIIDWRQINLNKIFTYSLTESNHMPSTVVKEFEQGQFQLKDQEQQKYAGKIKLKIRIGLTEQDEKQLKSSLEQLQKQKDQKARKKIEYQENKQKEEKEKEKEKKENEEENEKEQDK